MENENETKCLGLNSFHARMKIHCIHRNLYGTSNRWLNTREGVVDSMVEIR